jgi:transposase
MWTMEHRLAAGRKNLRYPSDLSDAEWALVAPLIPPAERGGRKRTVDVREVLNGIFYALSTRPRPPGGKSSPEPYASNRCGTYTHPRRPRHQPRRQVRARPLAGG